MARKSSLFIRQSVIGLGFLSGLFTAIGIDPEEAAIGIIGSSVQAVWPDPQVSFLFIILPTLLLAVSVITAYRKGGILGLFSVLIGYFAGLSVLVSPVPALLLLAAATGLGFLATDRRIGKKVRF
jgi:hypothetical protein